MKRKIRSTKMFRLPLIDLGLATQGLARSAEWLDPVAVRLALGVDRYWSGRIMRVLADRKTRYGPLVKRERLVELVQREIKRRRRERILTPEGMLAKMERLEAARQRKREKTEAARERRWQRIEARRQRRKNRLQARVEIVVQLRLKGWTWERIGRRLGVSRQRAHQMGWADLAGDPMGDLRR